MASKWAKSTSQKSKYTGIWLVDHRQVRALRTQVAKEECVIANINASTVAFNQKTAFRIYLLLAAILYQIMLKALEFFLTQDIITLVFLRVLSWQIFILFIYLVTHKTLYNMNKAWSLY